MKDRESPKADDENAREGEDETAPEAERLKAEKAKRIAEIRARQEEAKKAGDPEAEDQTTQALRELEKLDQETEQKAEEASEGGQLTRSNVIFTLLQAFLTKLGELLSNFMSGNKDKNSKVEITDSKKHIAKGEQYAQGLSAEMQGKGFDITRGPDTMEALSQKQTERLLKVYGASIRRLEESWTNGSWRKGYACIVDANTHEMFVLHKNSDGVIDGAVALAISLGKEKGVLSATPNSHKTPPGMHALRPRGDNNSLRAVLEGQEDHNRTSAERGILLHPANYGGNETAESQGCIVPSNRDIVRLWGILAENFEANENVLMDIVGEVAPDQIATAKTDYEAGKNV